MYNIWKIILWPLGRGQKPWERNEAGGVNDNERHQPPSVPTALGPAPLVTNLFFFIKACQHILLHQKHKIMIFKKASYDPFNVYLAFVNSQLNGCSYWLYFGVIRNNLFSLRVHDFQQCECCWWNKVEQSFMQTLFFLLYTTISWEYRQWSTTWPVQQQHLL